MTEREKIAARTLARCRFAVGSYDKRFARDMASIANNKPETELSEKQLAYLWKCVYRYRRQIGSKAMVAYAKHQFDGTPVVRQGNLFKPTAATQNTPVDTGVPKIEAQGELF